MGEISTLRFHVASVLHSHHYGVPETGSDGQLPDTTIWPFEFSCVAGRCWGDVGDFSPVVVSGDGFLRSVGQLVGPR